jgi:hypothetical protein
MMTHTNGKLVMKLLPLEKDVQNRGRQYMISHSSTSNCDGININVENISQAPSTKMQEISKEQIGDIDVRRHAICRD